MQKKRISWMVSICLAKPLAVFAGDITVSPTLDVGLYQTNISSPQEELRRQDAVSFAKLTTDVDYKSPHYTSQLQHTVYTYRYSATQDANLTMHEVLWSNQMTFWQDRLLLDQSVHRWRESYDQVGGSFVDDVYTERAPSVRTDERYGISYKMPTSLWLDGSLHSRVEFNKIKADPYQDVLQEQRQQKSHQQGWSFGNHTKKQPILWMWSGDELKDRRRDDLRFDQFDTQLQVQIPVFARWYVSGIGAIQRYTSSTIWNYGGDDREVETQTKGAGLSWIRDAETSFARVMIADVDNSDSGRQVDWDAEFRWLFADRWSVRAHKQNRFYGDAYDGEFSYQTDRNQVSISFKEDVRLRYIPVSTTFVRDLYVCTPGDTPLDELDLTRCVLPPAGNVSLLPGQVVFFDIDTYYPLSTRLTLYRHAGLNWTYNGERWKHRMWVRSGYDTELTDTHKQRSDEGFWQGDWRLNSQSYLRGKWRYRALHSKEVPSIYTSDRFYSLGYHYEINRQSEWSISLQNINKTTFAQAYDYQDYRIMLSYQYLFGSKHKDRRSLNPSRDFK